MKYKIEPTRAHCTYSTDYASARGGSAKERPCEIEVARASHPQRLRAPRSALFGMLIMNSTFGIIIYNTSDLFILDSLSDKIPTAMTHYYPAVRKHHF